LRKLDKIIENPVAQMTAQERWAVFFRYIKDPTRRQKINQILEAQEDIAMACQVLRTISKDEAERARLMSEYKFETDHQSKMVQAQQRGEAIGEKRGAKQREFEIARNAIRDGLSVDAIQRITGLSLDEIGRL
jgi:predicted transposase/invertase (TIGR01784 family)